MPEPEEPTALYRLYDAAGALLYVGISWTPVERIKKHKWSQHWGDRIARHTVEWLESWAEAETAEAKTVRTERPLHNGTHNHPVAPFAPFAPEEWPTIPGRKGKV